MATSSSGIGFTGLLQVLLIALKLTGHITWTWPWVLSPMWMSGAFLLVVIGIFFGYLVISEILTK